MCKQVGKARQREDSAHVRSYGFVSCYKVIAPVFYHIHKDQANATIQGKVNAFMKEYAAANRLCFNKEERECT